MSRMKTSIVRENGKLKIKIGGEVYSPLAFKTFRATDKNVSEAYGAGIRLFDILSSGVISGLGVPYSLFGESWIGDEQYDFTPIDRQMELFLRNAPEGYFSLMFQLDTRDWYLEQHPGTPNSFMQLSQIAGDEAYRQRAAAYLKAAIRYCEEKWGDRIYGYFMLNGTTTEWFSDYDFEASHPIKEAAYQRWCNDPQAQLPSLERLNRTGDVFLQEDETDVYQARRFHAELITDLALYMAAQAQSVLQHKKLVGLYFGYLLELGGERLHYAGHLDYERLFLSPDVDMLSSPCSYFYRLQTDAGAFMLTHATLDAHNKLYYNEFDHRTHTIPSVMVEKADWNHRNTVYKDVVFPGADIKCKTEMESLNLLYREFLLSQANRVDLWWFDMLGGWFDSDGMREAIAKMVELDAHLEDKDRTTAAKIAVFAEGNAMYRVRKTSRLSSLCLSAVRRPLAEMGAPYDIYSIADVALDTIAQYDLLIFLNQYDVSPELKETIRRQSHGKTILWLYAPGYATDGENSVANIAALTGITVAESREAHGAMLHADTAVQSVPAAPYFHVTDTDATPLAYHEDGTVAAACKEMADCRHIYCSQCTPSSAFLRDVARDAGVFVYSDHPQVYVFACHAFIGVYNGTEEDMVIRVPDEGDYVDLITGDRYATADGTITLPKRPLRAFMLERLQ